MNKYDDLFEFRLANVEEIDKIMEFNRMYWGKPNHILATNKEFFEYEFRKDDRVGYFLALDKNTGDIAAAEGIYFYSENHIPGKSDMSSGMFLANPECRIPLVGCELMKRKFLQLQPRSFVGPGVNMDTSGALYQRLLHYEVERMRHFYILSDKNEYVIAKIAQKKQSKITEKLQLKLQIVKSPDELYANFNDDAYKKQKPYKDRWYVTHRYFEHPKYTYKTFCCGNSAVIVGREISVGVAKVFRIVDILGDTSCIAHVGNALKELINENDYEYIDLYENRLDAKILMAAGFVERTEVDSNIVPNYFEPYECKNIEVYTQFLGGDTDSRCFKGDGDQDRPNYI